MPLPRFERLPETEKERILAIARHHFAENGFDGASLNGIAAAAQLSRSAFYNYFDGKEDLFASVNAELLTRLADTIGPWKPAEDADSLWRTFAATHERLAASLAENPDDRALLAGLASSPELKRWIHDAFKNALDLGLVDTTPGRALLEAATVGVISAADAAELADPGSVTAADLKGVLTRLWAKQP
ncbi:TetR/AcrR family transcriptional regulator [Sinomonas sp. JGH33]|uniref:TetR/AcrR family transcriptional regulator n=1 Tax=Sinomonas terricola TaxID=3110330 RepID=A0ABU5T545_9MICC|nr:TetR/AcrR family transcriptional regulator [Sinomonas sp. JGH33]MEA5454774.1 TetR/AcrR family transcriptional regulator [Sinomonas sp. JGH33]